MATPTFLNTEWASFAGGLGNNLGQGEQYVGSTTDASGYLYSAFLTGDNNFTYNGVTKSNSGIGFYISKQTSTGAFFWTKLIELLPNAPGNYNWGVHGMYAQDNYVYFTGTYSNNASGNTLSFTTSSGTVSQVLVPSNPYPYFLQLSASTGEIVSAKILDIFHSSNLPAIAADSTGNIYFGGGSSTSGLTFSTASGSSTRPSSGPSANIVGYLLKYNPSNSIDWVYYLDGEANEFFRNVSVDSSNNIYITGGTSTSGFTISTASGPVQRPAYGSNGVANNVDIFVVKLNSSGVAQWAQFIAGSGADSTFRSDIDSDNNLYVSGNIQGSYSVSTVSGIVAGTTLGTTSSGAILAKINSSGVVQWINVFDGINNETGWGAAEDGDFIHIAGQTSTSGFTVTTGAGDSFIRPDGNNGTTGIFIASCRKSNGTIMGSQFIDSTGANDFVNGISAYNGDIYVPTQVFASGFSIETASGTVTRTLNGINKSAGLLVKYTRPINEFTLPSSVYLPRTVNITAPTTYTGYTGTFTYTSSNTNVATVNGNVITFVGAGTTVINAIFTTSGGQSFKTFTSVVAIVRTIDINIPLEIDAGSFATAVTVQGEAVSYNHFNLPLEYETQSGDVTLQDVAQVFQFKEATDQAEVAVDAYQGAIGSFANGQAVIKELFKSALDANALYNIPISQGPVYADNSTRDTSVDPLKFYVDKDTHTVGASLGSTLKSYLQEYLYDNLSATIGLAATSGNIDITMSRSNVDASEIIAEALAAQLCGSSASEQGVAAAALRQNIYEQIFTLAPERFQDSSLMRQTTANDVTYKNLPLVPGDSLAFLVTFKFPASQITAPVIRNAIRTGNSSTFVDTGSKIEVTTVADSTSTTGPNLSDFPNCTVLMRTKLMSEGAVPVGVYTRFGPSPNSIPDSPSSLTTGVIVDNVLTHSYDGLSRDWTGNFGGPDVYFRTKAFAHGYITSSSNVIIRMDGIDYDMDTVENGFWTTSSSIPDPRFYFHDLLERDAAKIAANPNGVSVPTYTKPGVNGGDGLYQFVLMEIYTDDTYTTLSGRRVAIMKINTYGVVGSAFSGWSTRLQMDPTSDPFVFELNNVSVVPGEFVLLSNTKGNGAMNETIYDGLVAALDMWQDDRTGQISLVDDTWVHGAYLEFSGASGTYNLRVNLRDPKKVSFELTPA